MRSTPAVRLAAAGLGALVLLAVVALASRGGLGDRHGGGGRPAIGLLDYGFTIFLVLYALAIPFALWAFFVQGREARVAAVSGKRGPGLLTQLVVFVLVAGLMATAIARFRAHGTSQKLQVPPTVTTKQRKREPVAATREPRFQWSVVVALAVLGAGAAGYVVLRRRRLDDRGPSIALTTELGAALDDAIDDVRAEADPRRAVIKAYARMEQILAAHGLPRHAAEAPYEYLARALGTVAASGASVQRLTDLYEEARFSTHAIPPALREEAIAALTAVRDELRAAVS